MDKHVWNVAMCMLSRCFRIPLPQQLTTWADTVVYLLILPKELHGTTALDNRGSNPSIAVLMSIY